MKKNYSKEVCYLTFDIFEPYPIVATYSTRLGGVSEGHFSSMNLGYTRGDLKSHVDENYRRFCEALHVPFSDVVLSSQYHHSNILKVTDEHRGMGVHRKRNFEDVDGLRTDIKGLPLVTFYADCVPVFFYDTENNKIAVTHAGWRGTALGIVRELIQAWQEEGSQLEHIRVGIGPAICQSCYEVTEEVIDAMNYEFASEYYTYYPEKNRYHIDLKGLNKAIIIMSGVKDEHIEVTDYCTKCHPSLFFSHREHGNNRGTQIGLMMLKES